METTFGTLLDGRVGYEQPARGYRTGIEPVLLAASVPVHAGERVLDAGTGAGAVLLCLAARVPGVLATGIEIDPVMAEIAIRNVRSWPGLTVHVGAVEDGLGAALFDHACANPPWHDPASTASPDRLRARSKQAQPDTWRRWCGALARMVRPGGSVTMILPALRVGLCVAELERGGAGGGLVRPLAAKRGRAAKICLVQARRGDGRKARSMDALILHDEDGGYTAQIDAVLRGGGELGWV